MLADAVWVIRTFKPDVIICRFPATGEGGHGHHTASAILAEEAFTAAADPSRFPEQLRYTATWQAKRIVWNTFNFGGNNTTSPDQLKIDVGGFNPLLGKYNGEIAAESRSMHKSQGFGSEKSRGTQWEYFKHIQGEKAENDLFDGVDISWNRFEETKNWKAKIAAIIQRYQEHPDENLLPQLMDLYASFKNIRTKNKELATLMVSKQEALKRIILGYNHVWAEATVSTPYAAANDKLHVKYSLLRSGKHPVSVISIQTAQTDTLLHLPLAENELATLSQSVKLPAHIPYTSPYWLKTFPEKGLFQVHDLGMNTKAENDAAVSSVITFKLMNDTFSISLPVRYKSVDPVKGERYQPLHILPPVAVNIPYSHSLFTDTKTQKIPVTLSAYTDSIRGRLNVKVPKGWKVNKYEAAFHLAGKGTQTVIPIEVTPDGSAVNGELHFEVETENKQYDKRFITIEYDHILTQVLLQPATLKVAYEPIEIPKLRIGYIPGAGDDVADLLKQLNMDVTILSDEQLATAPLHSFDVLITGVRAYNTNVALQALHGKMMDFVEQGGNLIVQYNTNSRVGPLKTKIGPYPFVLTRDRVTDETAPITLLQPAHPAFNTPNKISQKDFEGWIQERGIYFASDWDEHYQPLLRMHDPGEKPHDGSLIVAPYGKGNFVYTGLVFFRELPAGVPGAYKLFLNLLALPKHP